jgi:hypothetical protein
VISDSYSNHHWRLGTRSVSARTFYRAQSELLDRLIVDRLPPEAENIPAPAILYAIYYRQQKLTANCE